MHPYSLAQPPPLWPRPRHPKWFISIFSLENVSLSQAHQPFRYSLTWWKECEQHMDKTLWDITEYNAWVYYYFTSARSQLGLSLEIIHSSHKFQLDKLKIYESWLICTLFYKLKLCLRIFSYIHTYPHSHTMRKTILLGKRYLFLTPFFLLRSIFIAYPKRLHAWPQMTKWNTSSRSDMTIP